MAGGPGNPLGARAMYLGVTIYRIHGTNQPSTIGGQISSGCIRMVNEDVPNICDDEPYIVVATTLLSLGLMYFSISP
jgi:lipoprotein-anchoring transpeptidase ErfK/SrfK